MNSVRDVAVGLLCCSIHNSQLLICFLSFPGLRYIYILINKQHSLLNLINFALYRTIFSSHIWGKLTDSFGYSGEPFILFHQYLKESRELEAKMLRVQFQKKSSIGYQRYLETILQIFSKEIPYKLENHFQHF